ncbi:EamA family transporter [Saccharopolyspora shandongensis]|uniref:EamA family transporter n=1 Tax=Saccharopolyspora shandongensis TaxID=418495 RepID=UPI0033C2057F
MRHRGAGVFGGLAAQGGERGPAGFAIHEAGAETAFEGGPAPAWLAFGHLVLIDSPAGFALYNWLLRATTVALISTYAYAVPVVAYLIGVLALAEPFRPAVLGGAAAIVIAVAYEIRAAEYS